MAPQDLADLLSEQSPFIVLDPSQLFELLMGVDELKKTFEKKFSKTRTKGIDRLTGYQYNENLEENLKIVNRKCSGNYYEFTPYAEVLRLKGRDKNPRVISIPTVRDRLVLHQLKDVLASAFPECVPKARANSLIHKITRELKNITEIKTDQTTKIFGSDIQKFYDDIDRSILFEKLAARIKSKKINSLIQSAINTPTVPRNYARREAKHYLRQKGIPQGLAISNILAAIYLADLDTDLSAMPIHYSRYVDDILIFGEEQEVLKAKLLVEERLIEIGLKVHTVGHGKSHLSNIDEAFCYLGYLFSMPKVTVRPATVERFLQSIVGKFSDYTHNTERRKKDYPYLTADRQKEIFITELNERITGAISEKRRYGWIAYFSEITDIELLKKIDRIVGSFFERLVDFGRKSPPSLKSLVRAFYEIRYSPFSGYIHNYDSIVSREDKHQFLVSRGRLDPLAAYTEEEIFYHYERYRNLRLSDLEPDDAMLY